MNQRPRSRLSFTICSLVISVFLFIDTVRAADAQDEWKKIIEAAKKEGKIVAGGPPTATLRKQYQEAFEKKFGIELELVLAPGWQNAGRATAEFKAGVRYFDVLHGGSGTLEPLMHDNMLAVFSDYMVLPEVKDPRQWWGGHMWEDNIKSNRFIYSFAAGFSVPPFFNARFDEAGGYEFLRRFFEAQMERQNRIGRAADGNRRSGALGILDESQRERVLAKTRGAKPFH